MKALTISLFISLMMANTFANDLYSNSDLSLSLKTNDDFYKKSFQPIWKEIPNEFNWGSQDLGAFSSNVTGRLEYATLKLINKGDELFSLYPIGNNQFHLKWRLNNFRINADVSITFKFRKMGINISHTETFQLVATSIPGAESLFEILAGDKISFILSQNKGFALSNVDIKPQNGLGKTLRWIYSNIFSEQELKQKLKGIVNEQLANWVSDPEFIQSIEDIANNKLEELENLRIKISELATNVNIDIKKLQFEKDSIDIKAKTIINNDDQEIHECAQSLFLNEKMFTNNLADDNSILANGNIFTSHYIIENSLLNLIKYKRFDKENKTVEPLLCFGYQNLDESGEPLGVHTSAKLFLREYHFTYIAYPLVEPSFSYNLKNQSVNLKIKMAAKLKGVKYPKIFTKDGKRVEADLSISFKLINTDKGLTLEFDKLKIDHIKGNVYLRLFKYSPKVFLSIKSFKKILSKEITDRIREENLLNVILDKELSFENFNLQFNNYLLRKKGHEIEFDLFFKN